MYLFLGKRRIFYDMLGDSPTAPVACLTHSLTADSGMWAEQVPSLLAAGYRVLRIDMRGHGASDPVEGDYSMGDLADDVAHVLTTLGLSDVTFIGLSIGGMLGQSLMLRYPHLLRCAVLCDTLPAAIPAAKQTWIERQSSVREAQSLAPLAQGTMERWFTPGLKRNRPARWQEIHTSILTTSAAGYLGCAAALQNFDFTAQLPGVKMPVLVICGAADSGTPPAENQRLASLIPGARYVELADSQHLTNVEQPKAFNAALLDWLASVHPS